MFSEKNVLLVEDEPIIGFALEQMIEDEGARTYFVSTVAEGRQILAKERIDFAILDVNLNGEMSYPLAEDLADRNCPFLFATGYGSVTHPQRFANTPTITKPYNIRDIRDALS